MYNLMGGCNIPLKNSFLSLEPAFMVMTDMQNWREDVQLKVHYNYQGRSFYAGLGYSPDISTTVFVGGYFHGVTLGYSYQMYTSRGHGERIARDYAGNQTELDLFKKARTATRASASS
jgi:hypothetical protein